jgi:hypothetical protein
VENVSMGEWNQDVNSRRNWNYNTMDNDNVIISHDNVIYQKMPGRSRTSIHYRRTDEIGPHRSKKLPILPTTIQEDSITTSPLYKKIQH